MIRSFFFMVFFFVISAQAQVVSTVPVGSAGIGRQDAQIEVRNGSGTGHALISIFNARNPGDTAEEGAVSYGAYDSYGSVRQVGSISAMWSSSADPASGIGVLRFNADTAASAGDIAMRIFGTKGIALYGDSETLNCGGRFLCINRGSGIPSISGINDLVLEGKVGGAGAVFLNAYGGGDVYIGGQLRFMKNFGGCPASVAGSPSYCLQIVAPDGGLGYIPIYR
jgi:hypothetical protein